KAGISVTVVAGDRPGDGSLVRYPKEEEWEGIRIRRFAAAPFDRNRISGWVANSLLFYPNALWSLLRLPPHDLMVFLSDPPLVFALGPILRQLKGTPYACWSQDVYPEAAVRLGILRSGGLLTPVLSALSRLGLRGAGLVIAIGEGMAGLIEDKGVSSERIAVVHNWADGEQISPVNPRDNSFLKPLCLEENFNVLYSGNMGLGNDFETLIPAVENLKMDPLIRFIFIGDGKRRGELFNRMGNLPNVRFFPFQKESGLSQSLSGGTVHLVTLRKELSGVLVPSKIYGAMAAGRPIIFIGPEESEAARIIRDEKIGFVMEPGDSEGLVEVLRRLSKSPEQTDEMGRRARALFESRFDRKIATQSIRSVLVRALEGPLPESMAKRLFDMVLSGFGLIGSLPLWIVFSILIKREDGGPVFYPQARTGKGGRRFNALKFRSMVPDAEEKTGPVQAEYNDSRVTRIGKFLRATAMDELPQLLNIFKGDMSFVGPRALRPREAERKIQDGGDRRSGKGESRFHLRHRIRPGLTGLAQIYAPRDATRRQKLRYDMLYLRRRS
ncbi:MAG TPA: sugar transferase, partial [Nitrospiria bacterium]|nr:sugar transferase [Nitrospiria bacterium]